MKLITLLSDTVTVLTAFSSLKEPMQKTKELLDWLLPQVKTQVPDVEINAKDREQELIDALLALMESEQFANLLAEKIEAAQPEIIKEKNIVRKDIERVKKIRIGDKEYNPDDTYHRKNIVEGNISDADEFILGDGH